MDTLRSSEKSVNISQSTGRDIAEESSLQWNTLFRELGSSLDSGQHCCEGIHNDSHKLVVLNIHHTDKCLKRMLLS